MSTTKLSSKGQIVLPKSVRQAPRTQLDDVFGSVRCKGRPKSVERMSEAAGRAATRRYRRAVQR